MGLGQYEPGMKDLFRVREMFARLERPYWMPNPTSWVWRRPDGRPQGFGLIAPMAPGMSNLLWLALDMSTPPRAYDTSLNGLYQTLLTSANSARLAGEPLLDVAGLLPLREFAALLPGAGSDHPTGCTYPLLSLLAERRLRYADT